MEILVPQSCYICDVYPECQGDFGKGPVFTKKKKDEKVNFLGFSLMDENSLTVIVALDIPDGNVWMMSHMKLFSFHSLRSKVIE